MRTFNLDLENARKICERFNLSEPKKVERMEEWMINDVFSIDRRYVVKINTGHPKIPKLKKEEKIYNKLTGKIPVPKIYGYDSSKKILLNS